LLKAAALHLRPPQAGMAETRFLKTTALQVAIREVKVETVNTTEPQTLKIALAGLQGRTEILATGLLFCH